MFFAINLLVVFIGQGIGLMIGAVFNVVVSIFLLQHVSYLITAIRFKENCLNFRMERS